MSKLESIKIAVFTAILAGFAGQASARWMSKDPMGLAAGINPYVYVNNNPTDLIDPFGLDPNIPYQTMQAAQIAAGQWNAGLLTRQLKREFFNLPHRQYADS